LVWTASLPGETQAKTMSKLRRQIVGHESAAVSRQYAHLSTDDLRSATQLPDVTNA